MLSHVAQRRMARIDHRIAGSEQCDERRLRPLQMEGDFVVAVRGYLGQIAVPRLARVETKLLAGLSGQEVPGAFDVLGGERLAVVPVYPLPQGESRLRPAP